LSGKPVRPGQSPDGSLLIPLEKSRGGEDAPEFVVEVVYFTRGTKWDDKGNFSLALPALDLPVSRTGLLVYYPPRFKVTAQPGVFRTETYQNPSATVFDVERRVGGGIGSGSGTALGSPAVVGQETDRKNADTRELVNKFFSKSQGSRAKGILPIRVDFPAFGPSMFLVAELTSPGQSPSSSLNYQRDKKGGAR
jgi:hypothetical protein